MSTLPEDFDVPEDRGPPPAMMDPFFDLRGALIPSMQCYSLFHQRHWLAYLVELGALTIGDGHSLHVNQRGFVTAVGIDVLPAERLRGYPPEMLHGAGGEETLHQMRMEAFNFHAAPDSQRPSPVADEIIATISDASAMRYVVWNRVLDTLRTAPPERCTPASLVQLIQPAIRREDETWLVVEDFDQQVSVETLGRLSPSLAWLIRDLMGLEALHDEPFETIRAALPVVYDDEIRPMLRLIRRIKSVDEPEASKSECFRRFLKRWKDLKREFKSNKLAPTMREHLECLEGSPLLPKREGMSNLRETRRPDGSVSIDLTME